MTSQINTYPSSFYLDTGALIPGDVTDFKFYKSGSSYVYEVVNSTVYLTFPIPQNINLTEITSVNLKFKCKWLKDRLFVSDGCDTSYNVDSDEVLCNFFLS